MLRLNPGILLYLQLHWQWGTLYIHSARYHPTSDSLARSHLHSGRYHPLHTRLDFIHIRLYCRSHPAMELVQGSKNVFYAYKIIRGGSESFSEDGLCSLTTSCRWLISERWVKEEEVLFTALLILHPASDYTLHMGCCQMLCYMLSSKLPSTV